MAGINSARTVADMSLEALLAGLNPRQREAVEQLTGPLLVVAGPGSGKTRVLTHRVAALVETGVDPRSILALTFTNKAAEEMRERISSLVSEEAAGSLWVSTFHAFCLRVLRRYSSKAGLPANFTVLDASDSERVVKGVLADLGHSPEDARVFHSKISFAKNRLETSSDLAERGGTWVAVAEVFEGYQAKLRSMAAVDFDDLLNTTLELVREDEGVLEALRARFRSILVDEWQDTNACQYQVVALLAREHRQLCVVGDQQQAIYGWRGSTPEVLERFTSDFPETKVVVLEENYRSTPEIVAVAQAIIDASPTRFHAQLKTSNKSGTQVRCVEVADAEEESKFVVTQLRGLSGSKAVLMRTNAQTRVFETELTRLGIAYQLVGAVRFFDRAEVKDAMSYLRVLVNPADSVALVRAAGVPRRGLGEASIEAMLAAAVKFGVSPGLAPFDPRVLEEVPSRSRASIQRFAQDLATVSDAAVAGVGEALRAVLGLGVYAHHSKADTERAENLNELVAAAELFDTQGSATLIGVEVADLVGTARLASFLEAVTLSSSTDASAAGASVSLITAHASKGREFDHVFVVGVEDGLYPHQLSQTADGVDEERRLFFVAVSRARSTLVLSHRQRRFMNGEWEDAEPSPFLDHLPAAVRRERSARKGGSRFSAGPPRGNWSARPAAVRGLPQGQRVSAPSGPRLTREQCVPGTKVVHPVFGAGEIVSLDDNDVTVRFSGTNRVLDLVFAPLEMV